MKSLFDYYGIFPGGKLLEFTGLAPAPLKDFHQLVVYKDKVIWRWWKITSRNDSSRLHPGELTDTHEDFINDEKLQTDIVRIFDQYTLDMVLEAVNGKLDYFTRLPDKILIQIMINLNLEDINMLACVSKKMNKFCNDSELWKSLYYKNSPMPVDPAIEELGEIFGWKKLFFTNKLQLQVQLRRVKTQREKSDLENGDKVEKKEDAEVVKDQNDQPETFLTREYDESEMSFGRQTNVSELSFRSQIMSP